MAATEGITATYSSACQLPARSSVEGVAAPPTAVISKVPSTSSERTRSHRRPGAAAPERGRLAVVLPMALAARHPSPTLDELLALPWVGTPPGCVLRGHIDGLFASAGRSYLEGALANTEGAVRSRVASGMGAGIVRRDQADQAERHGELKLWKGWAGHTWICWAAGRDAGRSAAVAAVREAVLDAWR
jgi:DNA-binding transcriptional LysR family regulator